MTTRTDYTPLEWEQLKRLPWLVAGGVLELCQTSWIGKLRGSLALLTAYRNSAKQFPNTALVQDLLIWSASLSRGTRPAPPPSPRNPEQVRAYLLEQCQQAAAILARHSAPEEAIDYKRWVLATTEQVAQVARRDGCLLGGLFAKSPAVAYPALVNDLSAALELPV